MSEIQDNLEIWIEQREKFWAEIAAHYRPELELGSSEFHPANCRPSWTERFAGWLRRLR